MTQPEGKTPVGKTAGCPSRSAARRISLRIFVESSVVRLRRQSKLPRWIHKLWAHVFGFFWLLCPVCQRPFGGHEWITNDWHVLNLADGSGKGTCPACIVVRSVAYDHKCQNVLVIHGR